MLNFLTEVAYFFSVIIRVLYPIYAISSLPYGDNLTFQPNIEQSVIEKRELFNRRPIPSPPSPGG